MAAPKKKKTAPLKRKGPPPWEHRVVTKLNCSTDAACFGIRDVKFHVPLGPQTQLLNEGKMGVFATGADGTYRFKITTEVLSKEERRGVVDRAHMGFLTTSGKIVLDSGTETSKPFKMPIGYATCTVFAMSEAARKKSKSDFVIRVRWVAKARRFEGDYDDYPTLRGEIDD